jgi:head-tail adaptor
MPPRPRLAVYDALITLEVPTLTPDGQGGSALTLTTGESRWARVERLPVAPQEGQRGTAYRYRVQFREAFELSEHTHLIWRGQRLQILKIQQEPGRFGALSVECSSGRGV